MQVCGLVYLPRNDKTHHSCIPVGAITSLQSEIRKITKQWPLNSTGSEYWIKQVLSENKGWSGNNDGSYHWFHFGQRKSFLGGRIFPAWLPEHRPSRTPLVFPGQKHCIGHTFWGWVIQRKKDTCVLVLWAPERTDAHIPKLTTGTAPSPHPWSTPMLWSQSSRRQKALVQNPHISKLLRDSGACWDWGPESMAKKRLSAGWRRFPNWNVTLGHKK